MTQGGDLASMKVAAGYAGAHYDTFRKDWRQRVRRGFPAPIEDRRPYYWRVASLQAWQDRAEAETRAAVLAAAAGPASAANENPAPAMPEPVPARRVAAGRAAVLALMSGAR